MSHLPFEYPQNESTLHGKRLQPISDETKTLHKSEQVFEADAMTLKKY